MAMVVHTAFTAADGSAEFAAAFVASPIPPTALSAWNPRKGPCHVKMTYALDTRTAPAQPTMVIISPASVRRRLHRIHDHDWGPPRRAGRPGRTGSPDALST